MKYSNCKIEKKIILQAVLYLTIVCFCIILSLSGKSGNDKRKQVFFYNTQLTGDKGVVIKIIDGDTYDLLIKDKTTIRVRMNGIDAPERGQPFYQKSKDFLGQLCFQKNIRIVRTGKDRYGRVIAGSYLEDGTSLSYEMVKNGFAWHFKKYSADTVLSRLETNAKKQRLGLWFDKTPVAPWSTRAQRKKERRIMKSNQAS